MVDIEISFIQGTRGLLCQVARTHETPVGIVVYVQPFFELANNNRHVFTRSAIDHYHKGFSSIIYDHYGSGDSQGELDEATLDIWRADLLLQLKHNLSSLPITLICFSTATLLLTEKVLELVDNVQLWQPEFNGKKVVKQLERLELLEKTPPSLSTKYVEVAGYHFTKILLDEIKDVFIDVNKLPQKIIFFLEWLESGKELPMAREKLYSKLLNRQNLFFIDDFKYWQATELQVPNRLLACSLLLSLNQHNL